MLLGRVGTECVDSARWFMLGGVVLDGCGLG